MTDTFTIAGNVARFESALTRELAKSGRSRDEITVVAVSKTFGAECVDAAIHAGLAVFGENRVQEAKAKLPVVRSDYPLQWHLIGHLQTNKAKDAVLLFDMIQSVDSLDLAKAIDSRALPLGKRQDILIQVNTTDERQKSGCEPSEIDDIMAGIVQLPGVRIQGLMTIGPFVEDSGPIQHSFGTLRREFDRLAKFDLAGGAMRYCSMGMSSDWPIALAEGANMLRIGSAIFGERS